MSSGEKKAHQSDKQIHQCINISKKWTQNNNKIENPREKKVKRVFFPLYYTYHLHFNLALTRHRNKTLPQHHSRSGSLSNEHIANHFIRKQKERVREKTHSVLSTVQFSASKKRNLWMKKQQHLHSNNRMVDCLHSKSLEMFHSGRERKKANHPTAALGIHTPSNMYYIVLHIFETRIGKITYAIQWPFTFTLLENFINKNYRRVVDLKVDDLKFEIFGFDGNLFHLIFFLLYFAYGTSLSIHIFDFDRLFSSHDLILNKMRLTTVKRQMPNVKRYII